MSEAQDPQTDDETAPEPAADDVQDETTEEPTDDQTDEQPELDEDQKADVPFDLDPDAVEAESGRSSDDEDDQEESESEPATTGSAGGSPMAGSGMSGGQMYVKGLCTVTNAIKDEYGNGERVDAELAYDLDLDDSFDEWLRSKGMSENMPPEQALLIGTCFFLVMSLGMDSELLGAVMDGAGGGD